MGEDGCQGLTANFTLTAVDVYQAVKVPIMKDGSEVAAAARNTDVVIDREAVFRLSFTVASGFSAHEVSARLALQNDTAIDTIYTKKQISASSQEAQLGSTIQIKVPRDKITATTRYAIEVVDCGSKVTGTLLTPRFPASDGVNLGARKTGPVKVKLVPMQANGRVPDTSETALKVYRDYMQAMYPTTSIDLSVTATGVEVSDPKDWNAMLNQITAKRAADAPAADIYYYGMLKPADSFRAYCGNGCTAGVGYVVPAASGRNNAQHRTALGLAFADATSADTIAHEVGHNHGRDHAPCVTGGSIDGVDPDFKYSMGTIGVYGFDMRTQTLITPNNHSDIMGYCNSKWISDYTYDGLMNRIAEVNTLGAQSVYIPDELVQPWLVVLVDGSVTRFGIPVEVPSLPAGEPEPAEILDASGAVIERVTVYRSRISDIDASSVEVPWPQPGWHSIQIAGANVITFQR